jgi:hypothetical protein
MARSLVTRLNSDRLKLVAAAMCFVGGCSRMSDRPETAPVTGRVTYRGEPVSGATVAFVAEGAPRFGGGVTDETGQFELTTFQPGDGAVVGKHVVTVVKQEGEETRLPIDDRLSPEERSRAIDKAMEEAFKRGPPRSLLPKKYADSKTSDLRFEVVQGENEFDIRLVD